MKIHNIFIAGLLLFVTNPAQADIINVPGDLPTIRRAVIAADDGDTVLVHPGRYVGLVDFGGRNIIMASLFLMTGDEDFITETVLDANGAGRVVSFSREENEDAVLCGFTIQDGETSFGGGVYINDADPTLRYLVIINNHAEQRGGGIYCTNGARPTIDHVTVSDNVAENGNGGIHAFNDAHAQISNSIFWDNDPDEYPDDRLTVRYSDMRSGYPGVGNIDDDPLFVDQDEDDYRLGWDNFPENDNSKSPCIDRGDPNADQDPDDTRTDMGALYFSQAPVQPEIVVSDEALDFGSVGIGRSHELTLFIGNAGDDDLEIGDITIEGDFFNSDEDGNFVLEPDENEEITITFAPEEEGEFEGQLTINSNDPEREEVFVDLTGDGMVGFVVSLDEGWNMISAPVIPFNPDIQFICNRLVEDNNLIILKDYLGHFYWPEMEFNDVPDWVVEQGYQVKVNDEDSLRFLGDFVAEDRPVPLEEGWTIVAYFPEESVDVITAFANIHEVLVLVKDAYGRFYLPEFNWGNMVPLERGQGYKVNVSEAVDLVWNVEGERLTEGYLPPPNPVHFKPIRPTGSNMSVLITSSGYRDQDVELGVFNQAGNCVGAVVLQGEGPYGMTLWGDDLTTDIAEGTAVREPLDFRLWHNNQEFNPQVMIKQGEAVYHTDGLLVMDIVNPTSTPMKFGLNAVYPNPFNSITTITYKIDVIERIRLQIIDVAGREVTTLLDEITNVGIHRLMWDASDIPASVYFVRLKTANNISIIKTVLIR